MRFDIVLNNLTGLAWTTGEIAMTTDGTPWRPLVHALDIGKAIRCALDAPREAVHNEVFNVGGNEQNYQVRDIAETVGAASPAARSVRRSRRRQPQLPRQLRQDLRQLPGFTCDWEAERGAAAARVFTSIDLDAETSAAGATPA